MLRSTASVYWVRSLVPMAMKSRWRIRPAVRSPLPAPRSWRRTRSGRRSRGRSLRSWRAHSLIRARMTTISSLVVTIGTRMRTRPKAAGAQDCAKLGGEQFRMAHGQADAAHAERGIGFAAEGQPGAVGLVGAEVQRADRDGQAAHAEHEITVGLELFILVRAIHGAAGTGIRCGTGPRRQRRSARACGDVGRAIRRWRTGGSRRRRAVSVRACLRRAQRFGAARLFALELAIARQILRGRMDDRLRRCAAIDQHQVVVADVLAAPRARRPPWAGACCARGWHCATSALPPVVITPSTPCSVRWASSAGAIVSLTRISPTRDAIWRSAASYRARALPARGR